MRNAYLEQLYEIAEKNKDVIALISDNGAIVYDKFRGAFPEQFVNFGISEASMVASAAGLASCGKIPFAYTITNFLTMRAFEFIRNDVCMQQQNVKLVGIGCGFSYSSLGPTHHGTEDIALMRVLPNMTILSPASPLETKKATAAAAQIYGPVYLRLGTGKEKEIYKGDYDFELGKGVILSEGNDVSVIGTGSILSDILEASQELKVEGISVRVINIHTIKPIDEEIIIKAAEETGAIITVEEHNVNGGLGSAIAEVLMEKSTKFSIFERMGLKDVFATGYGSHGDVKEMNGLSKKDIKNKIIEIYSKKVTNK